jgi:hypothetical protein
MSPAQAASEQKSPRPRSTSRRKAALVAEYIRELSGGSARRPRPRDPQGEFAG